METILKFLKKNKYEQETEISGQVPVSSQELIKLNKLLQNTNLDRIRSKQLRIIPRLQKNQIWTVKSEYEDFMGCNQITSHPFIVFIKTDPGDIEKEDFVRINVISPFIELASSDDVICNDHSIIGFPFLIETWNEQPLLSEILDEYLGYYEIDDFSIPQDIKLNNYQFEFRDIEISRSKYLSNSVITLLAFLERRQAKDSGVIISLFNEIHFPKFYYGQNQKNTEYALAAKSGFDTIDKFIHFKTSELPFDIYIRKNESGFIISILPFSNVKLFTSKNIEINDISNNEKTVFEKLEKGLYTLTAKGIQKHIKIRLK